MKKYWTYTVATLKVMLGFSMLAFGVVVLGMFCKLVWALFYFGFNVW